MEEYLLTTDCTDSVSSELSLPTVPSPESQDALGLTVPSDWRAPSGKENYCSTAGQQGDGFSSHPFPSCAPCTSAALPIGQPTGFEQPRHDHAELAGLSILGLLPPFTPYAAPETNDPISHFLSFPSSGYLQSYPLACSEAVGPSSTAAIPPELTPCQDNSGSGNCSLHAGEVPPTSEKPSFPITAAPPEMRTSTKRRRADDEEVAVAGPSGTAAQAPAAGPTVWTRDVEPESTAAPPAKRFRRTKEQVKQYTQDLPLVPCPVTGCGTLFCPTQRHKTSAHLKIHYGAQALKGTEELACLWGCRESIRGKAILSHVCDEHVGKPFMCPLKLELRCEWSSSRSGYQRQHMLLVHGVPDWKP
ncbi:hypothetical protein BV20DRAFT_574186 [Pilatotrama ljubarskyi]|nr:hypothetical protein BV20DRAFT_574186 [Pilatotrama ljubarskyi]